MNNTQSNWIAHQIRVGFFAPLDSLRFLARNKFLLVIGLAPHLIGLGLYIWALNRWGVDFMHTFIAQQVGHGPEGVARTLFTVGLYVAAALLYGILGLPVVSVVASPVYDYVAEKAYRERAKIEVSKFTLADYARSFLSECSKLVLITSCFVLFFFVPLLAPVGFVVSIWFFGWDHVDRTLSLLGLSFKQRLLFGVRHSLACFSLGVWVYVPFAGTILSFAMACSGAFVVAQVQTDRDLARLQKSEG